MRRLSTDPYVKPMRLDARGSSSRSRRNAAGSGRRFLIDCSGRPRRLKHRDDATIEVLMRMPCWSVLAGMRIPILKIYRAFPELDEFSDRQCEVFLQRVKREDDYDASVFGAVILGAVLTVIILIVISNILFRIGARFEVSAALLLALWFGGVPLGALLGRDIVLRQRLKAGIWRRLELIRCPQCKYSLLGQRVSAGVVTCSECGEKTTLHAMGLASADDLLPPADGHFTSRLIDVPQFADGASA